MGVVHGSIKPLAVTQLHVLGRWAYVLDTVALLACVQAFVRGCADVLLPQEVPDEQLVSAADPAQHLNATQQAVVGLTNLGNTCFFNSSVQLLLACAPLQQMLQRKEHDITRGPLGFALQQAVLHASGG
jgi:ubiquitin C-terminal hydrolase